MQRCDMACRRVARHEPRQVCVGQLRHSLQSDLKDEGVGQDTVPTMAGLRKRKNAGGLGKRSNEPKQLVRELVQRPCVRVAEGAPMDAAEAREERLKARAARDEAHAKYNAAAAQVLRHPNLEALEKIKYVLRS